jgi:hypothetical protein
MFFRTFFDLFLKWPKRITVTLNFIWKLDCQITLNVFMIVTADTCVDEQMVRHGETGKV